VPLPGSTPPYGGEGAVDAEELAPGARAGAWELVRLIGHGGHGAVYLASHRENGRRAALKVLSRRFADSPEMASRFVREGRILSRLRHPNVVEILELGMLPDGRPYCAMELLEGRSLLQLLDARGRLPVVEALEILAPVCAALEAAHREGVVHRDVKASNVYVEAGDPPRVKLLDFGVARTAEAADAALTAVGQRVGSAHAMAPELIRGEPVDARADVYALGVLTFQLVTGTLPFWSEDPFELERLHLAAPPPKAGRLAPVSPAVDAVVERALAKQPGDRFSSAAAFLEALRAAAGHGARAAERTARGVAVHASVAADPDADEDQLLLAAEAEEEAARVLAEAGFSLDVRAGGIVLASLVLPESELAARAGRAGAVALAREVRDLVAGLVGPGARVQVCVHAGEVRLGPGDRRAGGALFRTAEWVRDAPGGFWATPQALE